MKTVAIVEDSPENRLLVGLILSKHFRVVEYPDGPSALAGFERERPDLVLLDLFLPGLDGVAVLARIRGREDLRGVPVIAFTAHASEEERSHYLELGFDEYAGKPILEKAPLIATIQRLLDRAAD
jgi:CheY-like chemotaxis protein